MSLQLAAQHLQQHGRNGDSMLVHMTPKEVKSLNDLAMAHGGQLTINPHTGLPEAGFLSSILPMVAGFALGPAGFGLSQMEAGLVSGGLSMALNPGGGLMGGLMAGVGAYGGAGLGDALAKAGMQEATQAELAKNQAFQQTQQAAQTQAAELGNLAQKNIAAGTFNPSEFATQAQGLTDPLNQMRQATMDRVAVESGFGAPELTTSTIGNRMGTALEGIKGLGTESGRDAFMGNVGGWSGLAKTGGAAAAPILAEAMKPGETQTQPEDKDLGTRYTYSPGKLEGPYTASPTGIEQRYFNPQYQAISSQQAKNIFGFADGGQVPAPGEPTQYSYDPMNQSYTNIQPPSQTMQPSMASKPQQGGGKGSSTSAGYEAPSTQGLSEGLASGLASYGSLGLMPGSSIAGLLGQAMIGSALANAAESGGYTGTFTGSAAFGNAAGNTASEGGSGPIGGAAFSNSSGGDGGGDGGGGGEGVGGGGGGGDARGGYLANGKFDQRHMAMATGGLSDAHYNLGGYSDGGRLLRGPGDGVSDSIPATIGNKQPARLADGEFVVPARIVSELGNGSTEAGARKLYAMMDRIQKARSSTVGKGKVAKNSRAEKYLPA